MKNLGTSNNPLHIKKLLLIIFSAFIWSPIFSQDKVIQKITFGSCSHQKKRQPILNQVVKESPNLFIYLGDNIYGDTRNMEKLRAKYLLLGKKIEFKRLRKSTEILAIWDDHDYGENDAGRHYPFKEESKEIFLEFWKEPIESERRKHTGNYHVVYYGPTEKRLQVILLDTRTFRDNLTTLKDLLRYKNDYQPCLIKDSTILGDQQWLWLENTLQQPAKVRIIATSTQYAHEYNGWESWNNFPHEHKRMSDLIKKTKASGVIFLSGDVHWGELSKRSIEGAYPIYDITSSGITQTWDKPQPNKYRLGAVVMENNYGMLEIDWDQPDPEIRFSITDINKKNRVEQKIKISKISF